MSTLCTYAIGRMTSDPVVRKINSNGTEIAVCNFSLAVNLGYGERETTEFIDCVAWRKPGEIIGEYGKKGRKLFVSGIPHRDTYTVEKEGVSFNQHKTVIDVKEFEFCDSNYQNKGNEEEPVAAASANNSPF